jgi:tetratricopeptide (TPR) repeat protein
LGLDPMETLELLDGLLRAGLARAGEHGWATAHDVVGETLAGELPADQGRRLHAKLAAALEADGEELSLIAPHLAAGGDTARAARTFAEAASGALDHFDNGEAVRLAERGLSLEPSPPTRGLLLETRAEARARMGDLSGATDGLEEALAVIPRGTGHSRVLARLAILQAGAEDYVRGAELADLALTESGQDPAARAEALAIRARIDLNIGDLKACRLRANEALALLQRLGDAHGRARVLDTIAVATLEEGRIPESIDLFDRVATLFTAVGDLFRAVMPRATRGYALTLASRFEHALADIDQALGLARMLRYPEGEAYSLFQRCLPLEALGRQAEGLDSAASALALAERLGHREWIAASLYYLGRLWRDQDPDRAEESLGRSLELAGGMPIWTTLAASDLAMVMIAGGRFGAADAMVARALRAGERNRKGLYPAHLAEAELAAARGDHDASALAERALAEALAGGHLISVPRLQELAGRR